MHPEGGPVDRPGESEPAHVDGLVVVPVEVVPIVRPGEENHHDRRRADRAENRKLEPLDVTGVTENDRQETEDRRDRAGNPQLEEGLFGRHLHEYQLEGLEKGPRRLAGHHHGERRRHRQRCAFARQRPRAGRKRSPRPQTGMASGFG